MSISIKEAIELKNSRRNNFFSSQVSSTPKIEILQNVTSTCLTSSLSIALQVTALVVLLLIILQHFFSVFATFLFCFQRFWLTRRRTVPPTELYIIFIKCSLNEISANTNISGIKPVHNAIAFARAK